MLQLSKGETELLLNLLKDYTWKLRLDWSDFISRPSRWLHKTDVTWSLEENGHSEYLNKLLKIAMMAEKLNSNGFVGDGLTIQSVFKLIDENLKLIERQFKAYTKETRK